MPSRFQKAAGAIGAGTALAAGADIGSINAGFDTSTVNMPARETYHREYRPLWGETREAARGVGASGNLASLDQWRGARDENIANLRQMPAVRSQQQGARSGLAARLSRSNIRPGSSGIYEAASSGLERQLGEQAANAQIRNNALVQQALESAFGQEMGARGQVSDAAYRASMGEGQLLAQLLGETRVGGMTEQDRLVDMYRAGSSQFMEGERMRQGEGGGVPWEALGEAAGTIAGTAFGGPPGGEAGGRQGRMYGKWAGGGGYDPYYAADFER